jgi:hypothetical protein
MRVRRRHTAWLAILAVLVGLVTISGAAAPSVTAALLGLFAVALIATMVEFQPRKLM